MSKLRLTGLMKRVLELYPAMEQKSLDLHTLFEIGGNDPAARREVLDAVATLIELCYLEPSGSDYYALTPRAQEWLDTPT